MAAVKNAVSMIEKAKANMEKAEANTDSKTKDGFSIKTVNAA